MKYTSERPDYRFYKVVLSTGNPIPIDADEVPKVIMACERKMPAMLRSGIFNPSFFVSVIEDFERLKSYRGEIRTRISEEGHEVTEYPIPEPLKSIFTDELKQLK